MSPQESIKEETEAEIADTSTQMTVQRAQNNAIVKDFEDSQLNVSKFLHFFKAIK